MKFIKMKIKKAMTIAILLVLTMQTILAFGVSPGRTTIMYENIDGEFFFTVFNSGEKEMDLTFFTSGELGEYIVLDEKKAKILPEEKSKMFRFTLNINEEFKSPGLYEGKITIVEAGESKEGFGVSLSISTQVALKVTDSSVSLRGKTILGEIEQSKEQIPIFNATLLILVLIGLILIIFKKSINKK